MIQQWVRWTLGGRPDFFAEARDGRRWMVIHSGFASHHAGLYHVLGFERRVKALSVSVWATLYTANGGLGIRLGVDPDGGTDPEAGSVRWSGWEGPDNGWDGREARRLSVSADGLDAVMVTVFLESRARWAVRSNDSRWRDVEIAAVFAEELEPEPEPPEMGCAGEIALTLGEIRARLERIDACLGEWARAREWVEAYNEAIGPPSPPGPLSPHRQGPAEGEGEARA